MQIRMTALAWAVVLVVVEDAVGSLPRLRVAEPCVAPDTEAIVRGSGFTPGKTVKVGAAGTFVSVVVRRDGTFRTGVRVGQSVDANRPTVRRFLVRARESGASQSAAQALQLVAPTAAQAIPWTAAASTLVQWRITGLAPRITGVRAGSTVYAHWLRSGRHVASTRFGPIDGPCSTITTTRPLMPQSIARPGRWQVRFDTRRRFARNSGGYAAASLTVLRP